MQPRAWVWKGIKSARRRRRRSVTVLRTNVFMCCSGVECLLRIFELLLQELVKIIFDGVVLDIWHKSVDPLLS
jgi:hypothetical protein